MQNRTTIKLKGKEFPLYETKRGRFNFEQDGFSIPNIANGNESDLLAYVYHSAKACAKREEVNFPYGTLAAFVDDEDISATDINKAFLKMRLGDKIKELPDGTIEIISEDEIPELNTVEVKEVVVNGDELKKAKLGEA